MIRHNAGVEKGSTIPEMRGDAVGVIKSIIVSCYLQLEVLLLSPTARVYCAHALPRPSFFSNLLCRFHLNDKESSGKLSADSNNFLLLVMVSHLFRPYLPNVSQCLVFKSVFKSGYKFKTLHMYLYTMRHITT